MKKTHDLVATVGEYTNAAGEKKKRFVNVGSVFAADDGRKSIKLDAVPVGAGWSGWLSIFPVRDERGGAADAGRGARAAAVTEEGDDIPF